MISIFSRKPKTVPPQQAAPQPAMEAPRWVARPSSGAAFKVIEWDSMIARVRRHFDALVVTACQQSEACIARVQIDVSELERIWTPLEREVDKSQRALHDAWSGIYAALCRDPSVDESHMRGEESKLHEQVNELHLAYQVAYRQVRARAAHAMLDFALHQDARSRFCGGCGYALSSTLIGQAQNLQCPHCGFLQTVEPGAAFRVFAAAAARWVGEWDAFAHYQMMKRLEVRIGLYRKTQEVPMALLHDYHNAGHAYWQTTLGVEAQLVPQLASAMPRQYEAQMKEVRRLLRNHWQWRAYEEQGGQ